LRFPIFSIQISNSQFIVMAGTSSAKTRFALLPAHDESYIDDASGNISRSRGAMRPSFTKSSVLKRGRREDRVRAAPAVSRANWTKEDAHEHTGSAEAIRPSLRNGFTAYFALSPVIGLSCHRHP
jgi:hypothetical protein